MSERYSPIDCGLHDELQLRVMRGREVEVVWSDASGAQVRRTSRLLDVFSRGGVEYLRIAEGGDVRLDRLDEVDGLLFRSSSC